MAAPSPSWNLVRVYGKWLGQNGTLKAGTYVVTVPARITNNTDDSMIPAGIFASGSLNTSTNAGVKSLDILVPATDDPDNNEVGWKLHIDVRFVDAAGEAYVIDVPYAARPAVDGGNDLGIDLKNVVLGGTLPQGVAMYKIGVAGGLARLDRNGNVVDAAGNVVGAGTAPPVSTLAAVALDTDTIPYVTGVTGGGITLDTDGIPYFTIVPGGVVALDTDGVPYLV